MMMTPPGFAWAGGAARLDGLPGSEVPQGQRPHRAFGPGRSLTDQQERATGPACSSSPAGPCTSWPPGHAATVAPWTVEPRRGRCAPVP